MSTLSTRPLDTIHVPLCQLSAPPPPVVVPEVDRPATPAQLERFLNVAAFGQLTLAQKTAIKKDHLEGRVWVAFSDSPNCTDREITNLIGSRMIMPRSDLRRLGFPDLPTIERIYTLSEPKADPSALTETARQVLRDSQSDLAAGRVIVLGANDDLRVCLPGTPATHFTISTPTSHPDYCIVHCSGDLDTIIISDLRGSLGIQRLTVHGALENTSRSDAHETVALPAQSGRALELLSTYFSSPAPGILEKLRRYLSSRHLTAQSG